MNTGNFVKRMGTANTVKKSWQVSTQIRVDSLHNEICQASF